MKLINRFLLKHFLRILLLSVATFIGIYLLIDFFENASDFIDHKATASDYFSYVLNSIPVVFVQILPIAILMTVVLAIGTLGRSNEITAMRACGISLWRIVQPFVLLTVALSLLLLALNEFIVPLNAKALYNLTEVKLQGKQLNLKRNELWYRDGNRIINIRVASPQQQKLRGIRIFSLDKTPKIIQRQEIPLATYKDGVWTAKSLSVNSFDQIHGDLLSTSQLNNQRLDIGRQPEDFSREADQSSSLNYRQLRKLVNKLEQEGLDSTHQRVDMHNRIATPFTCLIMAFLGIPFALQNGRNSNIPLGIGISLAIGVAYFILHALITALGYSGAVPPVLSAWTTNVIFLLLGIWLFLNIRE